MRRHDLKDILAEVAPYTMVKDAGVRFTIHRAIEMIERSVPGHMVECGTWKGGCGLAMLLAQRRTFGSVQRPVHFMDSFEGLPPAQERDGPAALAWQRATKSNCRASRAELLKTLYGFDFDDGDYVIWRGLFNDTLPGVAATLNGTGISLLRLDGDWYDSTRQCLDALGPLVSSNGMVIVDDYFAWDGCARATHDYLSANDLPYRIHSLSGYTGAFFKC